MGGAELSHKTNDIPSCLPALCSQDPLSVKLVLTLSLAFMVSLFCLSSSLLCFLNCWMLSYQYFTGCLYVINLKKGHYRKDACLGFRFFFFHLFVLLWQWDRGGGKCAKCILSHCCTWVLIRRFLYLKGRTFWLIVISYQTWISGRTSKLGVLFLFKKFPDIFFF